MPVVLVSVVDVLERGSVSTTSDKVVLDVLATNVTTIDEVSLLARRKSGGVLVLRSIGIELASCMEC